MGDNVAGAALKPNRVELKTETSLSLKYFDFQSIGRLKFKKEAFTTK